MTKEIKITVPDGYEIDKANSTFECIKFKKKSLTYGDIEDEIIKQRGRGGITAGWFKDDTSYTTFGTHPVGSKPNLERLIALNKLMNVARHLNKGVDALNDTCSRAYLRYNTIMREIDVVYEQSTTLIYGEVYFVDTASAHQAIEILGEDTIKTALGVFE
jgi:hypothetical protein